ncbi:MAG: hypothetical protein ABJ013_12905 [Halioglobus sp.]
MNLKPVLQLMIFMAVFAGCQGGRYYFANRLQELGIACALGLFLLGAWRGLFRLDIQEWQRWVLRSVYLIVGIMLTSAIVFSLNYEGNIAYSFFSAREFMLAFAGPGLYLLVRCGLPIKLVEQAIWGALIALMLNYLFFYFTMDLQAAFFSDDHTISNLVTFDEWRGFRLKPPLFAIMVSLLAAAMLVFQARSTVALIVAVAIISIAAYIWSIVLFRATLATMLLSVLLYPLLLSQRNRIPLIIVCIPIAVLAIPIAVETVITHFLQADGGNIRAKAFLSAFDHIPNHLLLGAGEDSAYGQSYQDIVAPYFFPSDLGLVGTLYKYGLIGVALYLFMHFKIWASLWRSNMNYKARHGRHHSLLWAFLIFMTAQTFNLALNPGLAYAQGITLGTIALFLAATHRD